MTQPGVAERVVAQVEDVEGTQRQRGECERGGRAERVAAEVQRPQPRCERGRAEGRDPGCAEPGSHRGQREQRREHLRGQPLERAGPEGVVADVQALHAGGHGCRAELPQPVDGKAVPLQRQRAERRRPPHRGEGGDHRPATLLVAVRERPQPAERPRPHDRRRRMGRGEAGADVEFVEPGEVFRPEKVAGHRPTDPLADDQPFEPP